MEATPMMKGRGRRNKKLGATKSNEKNANEEKKGRKKAKSKVRRRSKAIKRQTRN